MKKSLLLLSCLFLVLQVSFASALVLDVDMELDEDGSVREHIEATLEADRVYKSFSYITQTQPSGVLYDGPYEIEASEEGYRITLLEEIPEGISKVSFTLLFDDMVAHDGSLRILRTSFTAADVLRVKLKLPEGHMLAQTAPQTVPPTHNISTDGRSILLVWEFKDQDADIAVFYQAPENSYLIIGIIVVLVILVGIGAWLYYTKKMRSVISETLSDDEHALVEELRAGTSIQKEAAAKLGFSKSKISKIVRRLEEKGLVDKQPHFKTNRLKLLHL